MVPTNATANITAIPASVATLLASHAAFDAIFFDISSLLSGMPVFYFA